MTTKTYKVHLTKPWQLLALVFSSIGLFFFTNFILQRFDLDLIGATLALLFSITYFFIVKKLIVLKTELRLSKNEIVLGDKSLKLEDISVYKTHKMRGAGLKLKMTNGKTFRLSSNDNFCNSDEFARFVYDFENEVIGKPGIRQVKSFGQTKFGLYFAISSTILAIVISFQVDDLEFSRLAMVLVALTTLWSGIEIKKTFANTK